MFLNNLKTAWRNLWKRKGFSALNLLGLAIGMAACLLILQYVNFERSFDKFHPQKEDIYRLNLIMGREGEDGGEGKFASNHPAAGPAMLKDFPQVVECFRMVDIKTFAGNSVLSTTDTFGTTHTFFEDYLYLADSSILTMMAFPLEKGDQVSALTQPNTVVLSHDLAKKYFGDGDPLGKEVTIDGRFDFTVSGVLAPLPENTHMQIGALFSFATIPANSGMHSSWVWPEFLTYLKLAPGTNKADLERHFDAFAQKYIGEVMEEYGIYEKMALQSLTDIHLRSNMAKEIKENGNERLINFLTLIAILILIIAWVNYINLSTARSLERASEVGIRKVVGARRSHIIRQFLFEAALTNMMAIFLALMLAQLALPAFNQLAGREVATDFWALDLLKQGSIWLAVGIILVCGTFLSGMYPAFVLSSFRPVQTLKGKIYRSGKKISLRHILVVLQFAVSILLITGTLIVYYQLSFMRSQDLGFNPDQILVVKSPALRDSTFMEKTELLKAELLRQPGINHFSASSTVMGDERQGGNSFKRLGTSTEDGTFGSFYLVDEDFLATYEIELVAGRNFSRTRGTDHEMIILNEKAVKNLGFPDNESALGQMITHRAQANWADKRVIGVVKDINNRSLAFEKSAILYLFPPKERAYYEYYSLKVDPTKVSASLAALESSFESIFPGNPVEHFFLDEFFDRQYRADQRFGKIFGLFAGLAILVACLGLLGLASYTAARRTKEIGIRKVLGASVSQITLLLAQQFLLMVGIAALIGLPLSWWGGQQWLEQYAYRAELGVMVFLVPVLIVLVIAMLTMSYQTIRAARQNPVRALRYE